MTPAQEQWRAAVMKLIDESLELAGQPEQLADLAPTVTDDERKAYILANAITIAGAVVIRLCGRAGRPVEALVCAIDGLQEARASMERRAQLAAARRGSRS